MRYFYHLSACPIVRDGDWVQKWIDAVDPAPEPVPEAIPEPTAEIHPSPETRDVDQASSTRLSYSPPPRQRARIVDPIKQGEVLKYLTKPVSRAPSVHIADIPPDVKSLYREIRKASFRAEIIPQELRAQVLALPGYSDDDDDPFPEHIFRTEASGMNAAEAEALLRTVRRVTHNAGESARLRRSEAGWQHLVHTPMLMLAFEPESKSIYRSDDAVTTRLEPMMSAAIAEDSIPLYSYPRITRSADAGPRLAWSVVDSTSGDSDSDDGYGATVISRPPRQSKKVVDYAVVLDIKDAEPVQKGIENLIRQLSWLDDSDDHVNQTKYQPVYSSPIAVSILAGAEYQPLDISLHIGIWIAAWHKRMYYLRTWQLMLRGSITEVSEAEHPTLMTVPLIVVTGDRWMVYFAQDRGDKIMLHGPTTLGSTRSMLETFGLLQSLRAIRQWIVTDFYEGLRTWFSSEGALAEQKETPS